MNQVIIHCKPEILSTALDLGLECNYSPRFGNEEIDVLVNDGEYDSNHYLKDPDEQLCDHYGIDYDLVNCIELA